MSGAHLFVEAGLDEGECFGDMGTVGVLFGAEGVGGRGPLAVEENEAFASEGNGGGVQLSDGGVQVLRITGVGDPDGSAAAEHV